MKHSATLQSTIGFHSAESEDHALVRGACFGSGVQSTFADLGNTLKLTVCSDSSAARRFRKDTKAGKDA